VGFYLRKSFGSGPVRLNLSRSGLGFSFGVKGARVGVGPRGSYVHAGREGVYYRKSLSGRRARGAGARSEFSGVESLVVEGPAPLFSEFLSASLRLARLGRVVPVLSLVGLVSLPFLPWLAVPSFVGAFVAALSLGRRRRRLAGGLPSAVIDISGSLLGCDGSADPGDGLLSFSSVSPLAAEGSAFRFEGGAVRVVADELWLFSKSASATRLSAPRVVDVLLEAVPPGFVSDKKAFLHRNADGGPDRRFAVNPELFVVRAAVYVLGSGVFLLLPRPLAS